MDVQQNPDHCAIELGYLDSSEEDEEEDEELPQQEFLCHCCYQVLVDPTTLTCGHTFCRHCLAQCFLTSLKKECPECRQIWWSFPKINILFRDLVQKHFGADVEKRKQIIQADPAVAQALLVLKLSEQVEPVTIRCIRAPPVQWRPWLGTGGLFSGVLIALTILAAVFLVFHWSGGDSKVELLVKKPLGAWSTEEVNMWMENLGAWASPYRDTFSREQVNGRLLNVLSEQDLLKPPYSIVNQLHRRALLKEVQIVQELGFKRPQTLWEYKALHRGKSLFLLLSMINSPRLTILYIYAFDYYDSFLPLIHISCPSVTKSSDDGLSFRNLQEPPDWAQWAEFLVKLCLLPYQLLADFAWDWLDVHYWTSLFVIWNAFLLTLREARLLRLLWGRTDLRSVLKMAGWHVLGTALGWLNWIILWPFVPQFVCNLFFYWALYFLPLNNTFTLIQVMCPHILRGP
ncbi:bifunctional apoptosis regulator-like [Astyanax mexicanus]|uniref:bifunctional apoptosis regulator-like n=1 Tax=Astyanax mexicanus TaxID=7994 RepID=UPI0020CAC20C|nr:bifunctional apoptosis regulator-like [Astyanax mexicanus]